MLRFVALGLCLLAVTAAAAQSALQQHSPPQISNTIVSLQPTTDTVAGKASVQLAQALGFNSIRVIMPWTYPWQHEVINDALRLCAVAAPAAAEHMTLFLDVVPASARPPVTSTQITWYDKVIGDYLQNLIGPNGCAQGLEEIDVQVANEPNYSVFWPQATAAQDYTHLAVRTYKFIQRTQIRQDYGTPIRVVVGELNSTNDPVGFMKRMRDEAQSMNYHGPFFDKFSYHCYGTGGQALTQPDAIRAAVTADFGQDVPLLCTEYAIPNPDSQQYCQLAAMAQNSGLNGFGWFRLLDDPTGLPTGLYYNDGTAKPSMRNIPVMNAAALGGSISCG
jgi:hypothetical protein